MPTRAIRAITPETKVNIGILATLLTSLGGAIFFFSTLNANVEELVDGQGELKDAIDRNTAQLATESKALAVLSTVVDRQIVDISELKVRLKELEDRKN